MRFKPYPIQANAIEHAIAFLDSAKPGDRQLYAAPTGVGKSVVELLVQERYNDCWIVTPRDEIIHGMLDKLEQPDADPHDLRICTPIKLRNMLLRGDVAHPGKLIFDEGHHHEAETWQQLDLLTGYAPSLAYTATPYRGSPKSTRDFLQFWGEPLWIISYEEAINEGYISKPTFEMLPLVDDDVIEISGGEFDVTSIDGATLDRLGDIAEHSRQWYNGIWDRPTIYALPSSGCCLRLQRELLARGLPCAVVSANTPRRERQPIFEAVKAGILALLHINIVSEGVDLPLRRIVDLAPPMSPVNWVQQLGRITRPTKDIQPQYICTNRNILRHSYALEGVVPIASLVAAERAFPASERAHARVLGLEALGRFKPISLKLVSGVTAHMYSLSTVMDSVVAEFCCLVHPGRDPIWATKVNVVVDGMKTYGTWRPCDPPTDVRGFTSVPGNQLTEKQAKWWERSASRYGLDPGQEVNRKNFQALPVLADLSTVLR